MRDYSNLRYKPKDLLQKAFEMVDYLKAMKVIQKATACYAELSSSKH